jgi:hypothetical protein
VLTPVHLKWDHAGCRPSQQPEYTLFQNQTALSIIQQLVDSDVEALDESPLDHPRFSLGYGRCILGSGTGLRTRSCVGLLIFPRGVSWDGRYLLFLVTSKRQICLALRLGSVGRLTSWGGGRRYLCRCATLQMTSWAIVEGLRSVHAHALYRRQLMQLQSNWPLYVRYLVRCRHRAGRHRPLDKAPYVSPTTSCYATLFSSYSILFREL